MEDTPNFRQFAGFSDKARDEARKKVVRIEKAAWAVLKGRATSTLGDNVDVYRNDGKVRHNVWTVIEIETGNVLFQEQITPARQNWFVTVGLTAEGSLPKADTPKAKKA